MGEDAKRLAPLFGPSVGQLHQLSQGKHEAGEQRALVGLIFQDHPLLVTLASENVDRHGSPKAIDDPVFANPDLAVLGPLGDVVAILVDFAPRDKFGNDSGRFSLGWITSQSGPDRTVCPTAVVLAADLFFVQSQVQR